MNSTDGKEQTERPQSLVEFADLLIGTLAMCATMKAKQVTAQRLMQEHAEAFAKQEYELLRSRLAGVESRLVQAGHLQELTLANEIRWMKKAESAESRLAEVEKEEWIRAASEEIAVKMDASQWEDDRISRSAKMIEDVIRKHRGV